MPVGKKGATKIPKGYEPLYTEYVLEAKTTYGKPFKALKGQTKIGKSKPYVQPVKIMNPDALKGSKKRGK